MKDELKTPNWKADRRAAEYAKRDLFLIESGAVWAPRSTLKRRRHPISLRGHSRADAGSIVGTWFIFREIKLLRDSLLDTVAHQLR